MKTITLPTQPEAKSPAGAGFWLGLSGIRAALQALEQTGLDTSLKEALLRKRERSVPNIPT